MAQFGSAITPPEKNWWLAMVRLKPKERRGICPVTIQPVILNVPTGARPPDPETRSSVRPRAEPLVRAAGRAVAVLSVHRATFPPCWLPQPEKPHARQRSTP